jgi:hypothetical protein
MLGDNERKINENVVKINRPLRFLASVTEARLSVLSQGTT